MSSRADSRATKGQGADNHPMEALVSELPGGKGLVESFYELIWTKNNLLQTRCMFHKCPPVLVPDTVLLNKKLPITWYFTSLKTGVLNRRSKDLTAQQITDLLLRKKDPSTDISCVYVGCAKGESHPITEYLSPAGLEYFLNAPISRRTGAGLVQNFMHPKGECNFLIRVCWTPVSCSMDNCININHLDDPDLEIQERASTNDEKHCVFIPMTGNVLSEQLELLCFCIVEHIQSTVSPPVEVDTMVLNFNIDAHDRVWLLWCERLVCKPFARADWQQSAQSPDSPLTTPKGFLSERHIRNEGDEECLSDMGVSDGEEVEASGGDAGHSPGRHAEAGAEVLRFDAQANTSQTGKDVPVAAVATGNRGAERGGVGEIDNNDGEAYVLLMPGATPGAGGGCAKGRSAQSKGSSARSSGASSRSSSAAPRGGGMRGGGDKELKVRDAEKVKQRLEREAAETRAALEAEAKKRQRAETKVSQIEDKLQKAEIKAKAAEARARRWVREEAVLEASALKSPSRAAERAGARPAATGVEAPEGSRALGDGSSQQDEGRVLAGAQQQGKVDGGGAMLPPLPGSARAATNSSRRSGDASGGGGGVGQQTAAHAEQQRGVPQHGQQQHAPLQPIVDAAKTEHAMMLRASSTRMADAVVAAAEGGADAGEDGSVVIEGLGFGTSDSAGAALGEMASSEEASDQAHRVHEVGDQANSMLAPAAGAAHTVEAGDGIVEDHPIAAVSLYVKEHPAGVSVQSESVAEKAPATEPQPEPGTETATSTATETKQHLERTMSDLGETRYQFAPSPPVGLAETPEVSAEDYEDRPIGAIAPIPSTAPCQGEGTVVVMTSDRAQGTSLRGDETGGDLAQAGTGGPSFRVETSQVGGGALAAVRLSTEPGFKGREYSGGSTLVDEMRAEKTPIFDESSPWEAVAGVDMPPQRLSGGTGGRDRGPPQAVGFPHPQAIAGDARLVNLRDAEQFRSELRVATAADKFVAAGAMEALEGWRIGTSSTCMSEGSDALALNTIFDDEFLLPLALQAKRRLEAVAAVQQEAGGDGEENENAKRCETWSLVAKAEPSPLPDFGVHVERAEETLLRPGDSCDQGLPIRKNKGKVDKTREDGVEVVYIPGGNILAALAGGAEESKERIAEMQKVLGLPSCLWHNETSRADLIPMHQGDQLRTRSVRSDEVSERIKGQLASQPSRPSKLPNAPEPPPPLPQRDQPTVNRGEAVEATKQFGQNASTGQAAKTPDMVSVVREVEWALDEFVRYEDGISSSDHCAPKGAGSAKTGSVANLIAQNPPGGPPMGHSIGGVGTDFGEGEVVEIKFNVNLANDEERQAFTRTQQAKLASMLGLSVQDVEIVEVLDVAM